MKELKNLKLEELTTEQKIGMMLCARNFYVVNEEDTEYVMEMIRNHSLGCIQVPYDKPFIMEKVKEAADYPIIIVTDMEMGCPMSDLPPVPMMTLAACNQPKHYRAFARALVADAKKLGFNGLWSPVIDVLTCDGPAKVYRTFSDDPQFVARAAEHISEVFANNHFMSCGKHYPGEGKWKGQDAMSIDTHMANVASNTPMEEIVENGFVPYLHLMDKGLLPSIMVGHVVHKGIDPELPSSLSKKVLDLIRDRGFDGVCFTDSFAMMAILQMYGEEKLYGMAAAAGNDIILPNYRSTTRSAYENLLQNYKDGAFSEERLNEAVRRVLALQAFLGAEPENPDPFTEEDRKTYYDIAKDCITAITDEGVDAALPADNKDRLFVIIGDEKQVAMGSLTAETMTRDWYHPEDIEKKIHEEFPEAEVVWLPEYPNHKDNEKVLLAAARHKEVVFMTYCNTRPYLGTDCMTRRVESVINALIMSGKVSAVVHFGNPFAQKYIDHVPRRIFGYMMPESQLHAVEVLSGKLPAPGKLPYHVEFQ